MAILRKILTPLFGGTEAGSSSPRFVDNFTNVDNTLIASHIGDGGYGWLPVTGFNIVNHALIFGNRVYSRSSLNMYRQNYVMPSPNYRVRAIAKMFTGGGNGVLGRVSASAYTCYVLRYNGTAWSLFRVLNGVSLTLGTFTESYADGQDIEIILDMNGSTIKGIINGVERFSVTNSDITEAGSMGLHLGFASTPTTGMHIDSIEAALNAL